MAFRARSPSKYWRVHKIPSKEHITNAIVAYLPELMFPTMLFGYVDSLLISITSCVVLFSIHKVSMGYAVIMAISMNAIESCFDKSS